MVCTIHTTTRVVPTPHKNDGKLLRGRIVDQPICQNDHVPLFEKKKCSVWWKFGGMCDKFWYLEMDGSTKIWNGTSHSPSYVPPAQIQIVTARRGRTKFWPGQTSAPYTPILMTRYELRRTYPLVPSRREWFVRLT